MTRNVRLFLVVSDKAENFKTSSTKIVLLQIKLNNIFLIPMVIILIFEEIW